MDSVVVTAYDVGVRFFIFFKLALTFLGLHFFDLVHLVLGVVVVPPVLPRDVVHIEGWRFSCPRPVFCRKPEHTFVLSGIHQKVFVRRDATITTVIIVGIIFSAGDGSQFDEVLTRDATNSCCFLYPLSEGCTQDTYI